MFHTVTKNEWSPKERIRNRKIQLLWSSSAFLFRREFPLQLPVFVPLDEIQLALSSSGGHSEEVCAQLFRRIDMNCWFIYTKFSIFEWFFNVAIFWYITFVQEMNDFCNKFHFQLYHCGNFLPNVEAECSAWPVVGNVSRNFTHSPIIHGKLLRKLFC